MDENTVPLEVDPSVVGQRNIDISGANTAINEYNIELFEEKTETIDYEEIKKELFLGKEIGSHKTSNNLFQTQIEYSYVSKEGEIFKTISYILVLIVIIEVVYLTYKIIRNRREKRNVKINI